MAAQPTLSLIGPVGTAIQRVAVLQASDLDLRLRLDLRHRHILDRVNDLAGKYPGTAHCRADRPRRNRVVLRVGQYVLPRPLDGILTRVLAGLVPGDLTISCPTSSATANHAGTRPLRVPVATPSRPKFGATRAYVGKPGVPLSSLRSRLSSAAWTPLIG